MSCDSKGHILHTELGEIYSDLNLTGFWPEDDWSTPVLLGDGKTYHATQTFSFQAPPQVFCLSEGLIGEGELRIQNSDNILENMVYFDVALHYTSSEIFDVLKVGLARSRFTPHSLGHGLILMSVGNDDLSEYNCRTVVTCYLPVSITPALCKFKNFYSNLPSFKQTVQCVGSGETIFLDSFVSQAASMDVRSPIFASRVTLRSYADITADVLLANAHENGEEMSTSRLEMRTVKGSINGIVRFRAFKGSVTSDTEEHCILATSESGSISLSIPQPEKCLSQRIQRRRSSRINTPRRMVCRLRASTLYGDVNVDARGEKFEAHFSEYTEDGFLSVENRTGRSLRFDGTTKNHIFGFVDGIYWSHDEEIPESSTRCGRISLSTKEGDISLLL